MNRPRASERVTDVPLDLREAVSAADIDRFGAFVRSLSPDDAVTIFHDFDADGVTSGVILQRTLERLGFTNLSRLPPGRERDAWSKENRARLSANDPAALFLLDLGSRAEALADRSCLIDHHRPEGVAPGATLITDYERDPIPNTSLMTFDLCSSLAPIDDLLWIAALGVMSDLGDRAPFTLASEARRRYKGKDLKESVALINSARRASRFDPEAAARALMGHTSPGDLSGSTSPDVLQLRAAREEVQRAMAEAKKAAPVFAGNAALIRMSSPCQIHPLIAQIWRSRLPRYVVLSANEGYLPGRVNFSARSSGGEVAALDFLQRIELSPGDGGYGHGHDHASGGSLETARWNELLEKLGFPPAVFASAGGGGVTSQANDAAHPPETA